MSEVGTGSTDFAVAVDYLRSIVVPLRDSMTAACRIKEDRFTLVGQFMKAGDGNLVSAATDFLNSWSYGMEQLVELSETIIANLEETICGYEEAEQAIRDEFTGHAGDSSAQGESAGPVSGWLQDVGVDKAPSAWGTVKEVFG